MLKIIAIAVVLLVGGVLIAAAMRPDSFRVQRSASIKAAPEKIFPLINDLRRFNSWNPFEKKDPNLKGSYSGAASGAGAAYAFEGNKDVGRGAIEIIDSSPASEVRMKLNMLHPFEAHNIVEFTLRPVGDKGSDVTRVTWAIQGRVPYFAKIIHLFFDMDSMIGKDFESGLANLKARGVVFEECDMPGMKMQNSIVTAGGAKAAWFKDSEGNIMAVIRSI